MLSPEYYDHCADDILEQYAALEDAIISSMIKKLMKHGYMTESAKHQAEVIQETGMIYGDVVQIIANYTDATANQVKALFEDAGVRTVEIDNEVYREVGKSPVDIRQSDSMKQILEAGCRKTFNEMWNLTKTLAVITQREYIKACNNAYMQVSSGAFSYDEAIKNAVKNAAVGGLEVEYPSGSKSKLDVAIRRSVLTGVGQTCAEIGKMNAEANGCHLMEITAHSGARPGHVVWQGQLVTLTGEDAHKVIDGMYVFTLYEIGYGDVTGFKGANCRHDWYPYEPGFSKPNYTKEELEELNARNIEYNGKMYTEYEISQMQRYRERHIRELKRQTLKSQTAMDNSKDSVTKSKMQSEYQFASYKLKRAEQKLQDFCKTTGRDRERAREQVNGFSRSEAQKAVHAAKKYKENKSNSKKASKLSTKELKQRLTKVEDNGIIKPDGTINFKGNISTSSTLSYKRIKGEHSIEDDVKAVNPMYNSGDERYTRNCQRCVCAYEMRRRGFDVVAKQRILNGKDELAETWSTNGWATVFDNSMFKLCKGKTGIKERKIVCEHMASWGDGARAIVRVKWRGENEGSHVFIAEQVNGETRFLEPQAGKIDVKGYFLLLQPGNTYIVRVDNLEINSKIENCCEDRR